MAPRTLDSARKQLDKPRVFTVDTIVSILRPFFERKPLAIATLLAGLYSVSDRAALTFAVNRSDISRSVKAREVFEVLKTAFGQTRLLRWYAAILAIKTINAIGNRLVIDRQAPRPIVWREHVVVVTGGARGILGEVAIKLSKLGARVAVLDMAPKSEHGTEALYVQADVTSEQSMRAAKATVEKELGLCTMLIAGAGLARHSFLLDPPDVYPLKYATQVSDVNLHGVVATLKMFGQDMLPDGGRIEPGRQLKNAKNGWGGHILILGSGAAFIELPGNGTYHASKAGVLSLHSVLGAEIEAWHRVNNVRNSVICPLKVETKMTEGRMVDTRDQFTTPTLTVDEVASKIVEVLEGDRSRMVFMPRALYGLSYLRNFPPWFIRVALRSFGAFDTFMTFASQSRTPVADI